jgi:type I restriction enzyme M protein
VQLYQLKGKNGKVKKGEWGCDLVPKYLVINRYFAKDKKAIEQLEADLDTITRKQEKMAEEHSGEEGLLEEVKNDKGNITKGNVQSRVKEIKDDLDFADELKVLQDYLKLIEQESDIKKKIKEALAKLDKKVIARYKDLTEDEIKVLVVDDKWMAAIERDVRAEMDRISQRLTQRIKELAQRYETPLPKLAQEVETLTGKVGAHLKKMGFAWN